MGAAPEECGHGVASHVNIGHRRTKGGAELGTEKQLFPRDWLSVILEEVSR